MKRIFIAVVLLFVGCGAPRYFWPQGDVASYEVGEPSLKVRVLIASRSTDFKDAVVRKITESFQGESVYLKVIGVDGLREEDAGDYAAVVLINACLAWGMGRHVNAFIDGHEDQSRMIVLTTSGDGEWLPKMRGRNFDAVSSASADGSADEVAETIVAKIRDLSS